MTDTAEFHATIIESSARALAAHATELLLERCPAANAFGTPAFRTWQEHLTGRLLELANAMRAEEPGLFGDQLHWGKIAFNARGLETAELEASTDALHEALVEGLPPGANAEVGPFMAAARAALAREVHHTAPAISGPHGELASRYMLSLLEGDRRVAIDEVLTSIDNGLAPQDALIHVLVPVAREIGRMWHLGEITIGEEHFTTTTASILMGVVRQRLRMEQPNGRCVVIASVPGNRHELAGRIAGLLLEAAGWKVVDMGTELPAEELARAAGDFNAGLIVLNVMLTTQLDTTKATVAALRADERSAGVPIIVGGHVFDRAPTLWKKMGFDAHARALGQITELADAVWKARSMLREQHADQSEGARSDV